MALCADAPPALSWRNYSPPPLQRPSFLCHRRKEPMSYFLLFRPTCFIKFFDMDLGITVTNKRMVVSNWIEFIRDRFDHLDTVLVGLDIEWLPNLAPEEDHPTATIQLCINSICLVFQVLHADTIPQCLRDFLKDDRFCFCGVGVGGDAEKLARDYQLYVGRVRDLNGFANCVYKGEWKHTSLKKMFSKVFKREIEKPKEITLSKWDAEYLSFDQIRYAAIDAAASFQLAMVLYALNHENLY